MTLPALPVVAALLGPSGRQIDCDRCFELLDSYVELQIHGDDADAATPGMRTHLAGCPACREEHESLRAFVLQEGPR
jgi:hypothetical protein